MNDRAELAELLSEPVAVAQQRQATTFDSLATPFTSLVLFGAGGLARKTIAGLAKVGLRPLALSDNDPSLWGKEIAGLTVLSPTQAVERFGRKAAFVVTIWRAGGGHRLEATRRQLLGLGCSKVMSFATLFWKYPDLFLPYYALGLPSELLSQKEQILEAFSLWKDDASRSEFVSQLRWRLRLDFDGLASPKDEHYFPARIFSLLDDEAFVDCGAFDGDTLRAFLGRLPGFRGRVLALEPDEGNLSSLRKWRSTLPAQLQERIEILPMAAGSCRKTVRFTGDGTESASVSTEGGTEVQSAPLDELLAGKKPTFIKMDVEGAEAEALEGAKGTIAAGHPLLAVSVYHRPDHLWRLPLLIRSLCDQYRFFLRPHNEEGWDLVCYAVPRSRRGAS